MRRQAISCILLQLTIEFSSCTYLRVFPGSTLKLPCLSYQTDFTETAITWTYNGKILSAQSLTSPVIENDGLVLFLPQITAASEGEYVCFIKKYNMETKRTYNITVVAPLDYATEVMEGSTIHLQCHFSSPFEANALWFKEMRSGERIQLNLAEDSPGDGRLERLYPLDSDQTIILRDTVLEDAGVYHCESAVGEKLSTVHLIVKAEPTSIPQSCSDFPAAWESCLNGGSHILKLTLEESIAEFSMKLFSYLRESHHSSNLLFSPVSINGVLSHLLLGARGDTRRAIESAIYVPHDFQCVHFQMKTMREKLANSLQIASQIYYNQNMKLSKSFIHQSIEFYEAEPIKLLDSSEDNTQMINSWVANKTNNKITHLVGSVPAHTQVILVNAVSYSGQWKLQFGNKTMEGQFTKLDGDTVNVTVLHHNNYLMTMTYITEIMAQVARFPLTGESSLYILLPLTNKMSDLQMVEEKITDKTLRKMIEHMKTLPPQQVEVSIPKIKLDVQTDMNTLIKKLGLSSLFEGAKLCGLDSEDKVVLNDARHRAFLALTEFGVETGAATSLSFSRSFPSFSALRPFILLLWSDEANVPLFIGRVTDP